MAPWKRALLTAYLHGSGPYRAWWNRRAAARLRAPVTVLFYHRVADDRPTPWTCSRALFEREMLWAKRHFDMVSLAEAQRRIREGNPRPAVSITFDDGYADNNDFALPLLVREKIPCTYFVSSHFVRHGISFPHDAQRGLKLRPNTLDELRHWAAEGIEIGAHTRTHPDVAKLDDPGRLRDEVVGAGEELQQFLRRPIRYFAFPYGVPRTMTPRAFELAYEAGYDGVCSAYGAYNFPGDDAFHVQRIHGDDDFLRFRNWLTVDPRKLNVPRYQYLCPTAAPEPVGV